MNRLKRALLLLAVPLFSALFLSIEGDTTVGGWVRFQVPIFAKSSYVGPVDYWFVRRVDGKYEVRTYVGIPTDRRGLTLTAKRIRIASSSGFWAPTRVRHVERWRGVDFVRLASDEAEYWEAMGPTIDDYPGNLQRMLDELISRVPGRLEGLVEFERSRGARQYAKRSVLLSGYIHNAIVLLCATGGLCELARALWQRGLKRETPSGD